MCMGGRPKGMSNRRRNNLAIIEQQRQMHEQNMQRMQMEAQQRQQAAQMAQMQAQTEAMSKVTPPPVAVPDDGLEKKLKKKKSRRSEIQQASRGTRSLRIPLNTGTTGSSGGVSLNIPK